MLNLVLIFFSAGVSAEVSQVDLKRWTAYEEYVQKKNADDAKREAAAHEVKIRRQRHAEAYEKARREFRREEPKGPLGLEVYDKAYAQAQDELEKRLERHFRTKVTPSESLLNKVDVIKTRAYELKN